MKRWAALVALLSFTAQAQELPTDRPLMVEVEGGMVSLKSETPGEAVVVEVPPGYYMNQPAYERLENIVAGYQMVTAELQAENSKLNADLEVLHARAAQLESTPNDGHSTAALVIFVLVAAAAGFGAAKLATK